MANPTTAQLPPLTRLGVPRFQEASARVYRVALDALQDRGVPYLVGGALAFNAYTGIWRDTKDLDLFVRPDDARLTLEALQAAGFETEVVYESWLGKGWQDQTFVDIIWRNANGLFPVTDVWFMDRSHAIDLLGHEVRIIPIEELILSKMMVAGRHRFDGADIMHLFFASGERIDWNRLGDLAGEHAGLLLAYMHMYRWAYPGWREKVPEAAVERFEALARAGDSSFGPFRGRLLDLQSFQVDIEGWGMPDPHGHALEAIFRQPEGPR